MTLQQQFIQKQSKKGFTLVELVVVIAIIALLAAIAIPAVISVLNEGSEAAGQTNASTVNDACYNFYTLIKTGKITNQSKYPDGKEITVAAAPNSSEKARNTAAKNATVEDALKYSGISLPTKDSGGNTVYDSFCFYAKEADGYSVGTIQYDTSDPLLDTKSELTPKTKLHNLYKD